MPAIKVGLAPRKTSYFDPLTVTYLTLENPVKIIEYDDNTDLSKITHAVFCQPPALVLYEGSIPQKFVDAWKNKYSIVGKGAHQRADKVLSKSAEQVTYPNNQQNDEEVSAMSLSAPDSDAESTDEQAADVQTADQDVVADVETEKAADTDEKVQEQESDEPKTRKSKK